MHKIMSISLNSQRYSYNYNNDFRCMKITQKKITNLKQEEKITNNVRSKIHESIDNRIKEVLEEFQSRLHVYADSLHQEVSYQCCNCCGQV